MLLLAPMEGMLDHTLRDILTRVGGIDRCVSEFIRISGTLLPERAFLRIVPELRHGGRTRSGVPVRAQLLGSDPVSLAENAARLATLGPHGIDLNFGCPAKIVNRHGGGATLLDDPERVAAIVAAVRRAVPREMPVSAKMRLGHRDDALMLDNARGIAAAMWPAATLRAVLAPMRVDSSQTWTAVSGSNSAFWSTMSCVARRSHSPQSRNTASARTSSARSMPDESVSSEPV